MWNQVFEPIHFERGAFKSVIWVLIQALVLGYFRVRWWKSRLLYCVDWTVKMLFWHMEFVFWGNFLSLNRIANSYSRQILHFWLLELVIVCVIWALFLFVFSLRDGVWFFFTAACLVFVIVDRDVVIQDWLVVKVVSWNTWNMATLTLCLMRHSGLRPKGPRPLNWGRIFLNLNQHVLVNVDSFEIGIISTILIVSIWPLSEISVVVGVRAVEAFFGFQMFRSVHVGGHRFIPICVCFEVVHLSKGWNRRESLIVPCHWLNQSSQRRPGEAKNKCPPFLRVNIRVCEDEKTFVGFWLQSVLDKDVK